MGCQSQIHRRKAEQGQSFVELAISLVFFLVVVLGVLDIARIFYIYIALQDSAEAAAIYLAQHPVCEEATSAAACADPNNAHYRASHASGAQINWDTVTIESEPIPAADGKDAMVRVKMTYSFRLLTPIISDIVGADSIVLRGEAVHVRLID